MTVSGTGCFNCFVLSVLINYFSQFYHVTCILCFHCVCSETNWAWESSSSWRPPAVPGVGPVPGPGFWQGASSSSAERSLGRALPPAPRPGRPPRLQTQHRGFIIHQTRAGTFDPLWFCHWSSHRGTKSNGMQEMCVQVVLSVNVQVTSRSVEYHMKLKIWIMERKLQCIWKKRNCILYYA